MILYLDTSALVKLYLAEEHSVHVRLAAARFDTIASNLIAYAETRAALSKRRRMKDITEAAFEKAKREFERDWEHLTKLEVNRQTISRAAELVEIYPLKACDALHLAGATMLQRETGSAVTFACFDSALNRAASAMGLVCMRT